MRTTSSRLAHLVTLGERRRPGVLTTSVPELALAALAHAVINSEPAFGLFTGYASWDGLDPEPPQEHDDSEYGERWHASKETRDGSALGLGGSWGGN